MNWTYKYDKKLLVKIAIKMLLFQTYDNGYNKLVQHPFVIIHSNLNESECLNKTKM
jgi:hypothetical protein